jgi:hypothetical protein
VPPFDPAAPPAPFEPETVADTEPFPNLSLCTDDEECTAQCGTEPTAECVAEYQNSKDELADSHDYGQFETPASAFSNETEVSIPEFHNNQVAIEAVVTAKFQQFFTSLKECLLDPGNAQIFRKKLVRLVHCLEVSQVQQQQQPVSETEPVLF